MKDLRDLKDHCSQVLAVMARETDIAKALLKVCPPSLLLLYSRYRSWKVLEP